MRSSFVLIALLLLGSVTTSSVFLGHSTTRDFQPRGTLVVGAATQTPVARYFTIYVGITGFNSTYQNGLRLIVNESDIVTIRFLYNDTNYPTNNPHDVCIDAYALCSQTIDRNTPERSVTFTANIVGELSFKCVVNDCTAHRNLLAGVLDVKPYGGAAWVKTTLHLTGQVQTHSPPEMVLSAHMVDVNDTVVPGVLVQFYRNSTWGFAMLGAATTNSSGLAVLAYTPPAEGNVTFKATFTGSGIYLPSNSGPMTIYYPASIGDQNGLPFVHGQNPAFDLRIVGIPPQSALLWIGVVFGIVGSVWTVYLYAGRQLLGIWRRGREKATAPTPEPVNGIGQAAVQSSIRETYYPMALGAGIGMAAVGYGSFLALSLMVPSLALLLFPAVALVEALAATKLLASFS